MTRIMIAALAALAATAATAQVTETPPANPANLPAAEAAPPAPPPPAAPDEAQLRSGLAAAGYTDVRDLARDGDGWKATALHNGQRVPVKIGADGNIVPPQ